MSTAPGRRASESTATLGTDPRNPQTYGLGAVLANGARISRIEADHIVLQRDGRTHRLAFEDATASRREPPKPGAIDTVGGVSPEALSVEPTVESVTTYLRPRPIYDASGSFMAYELHPGSDATAMTRLGLLPGDRLVAVNGTPLTSPDDAARALRFIGEGGTAEVTLSRNGSLLHSTLNGHLLDAPPSAPAD